jgi:hypothetical protein
MLVEIINADGSTLNPVFSPEHKESVVKFYSDLVAYLAYFLIGLLLINIFGA